MLFYLWASIWGYGVLLVMSEVTYKPKSNGSLMFYGMGLIVSIP